MDPRREDREREPAPTNINPQQQAQPIQEQPEPYNIPPAQSVTRRSRPQTPSTLDKFEGDAFHRQSYTATVLPGEYTVPCHLCPKHGVFLGSIVGYLGCGAWNHTSRLGLVLALTGSYP